MLKKIMKSVFPKELHVLWPFFKRMSVKSNWIRVPLVGWVIKLIEGVSFQYRLSRIKHRFSQKTEDGVVLVFSHNLTRTGAPLLILALVQQLSLQGKKVVVLSFSGGVLYKRFREHSEVLILSRLNLKESLLNKLFNLLNRLKCSQAILNTILGVHFIDYLEKYQFHYSILVHEMLDSVIELGLYNSLPATFSKLVTGELVFSSRFVLNAYQNAFILPSNCKIIPQGVFLKKQPHTENKEVARAWLANKYNISKSAFVVICGGDGGYRKGFDLFIDLAEYMQSDRNINFVCLIGKWSMSYIQSNCRKVFKMKNIKVLSFLKPEDYQRILLAADLFALTSRSDPLPNVALDAMSRGLPVVAFKDTGGIPDLLSEVAEELVIDKYSIKSFCEEIRVLSQQPDRYQDISSKSKNYIEKHHQFSLYLEKIQATVAHKKKLTVTVIVPNYNYAKYLPERMGSILKQQDSVDEIVFLDDNSTDNSCEIAESILSKSGVKYQIIKNKENQGVFKQWAKGIRLVSTDLVWIAEADDSSDERFLSVMKRYFNNQQIGIAYCQSRLVDQLGKEIQKNVLSHTNAIDKSRWQNSYSCSGTAELHRAMIFRNVIMNAGSALMRRSSITNEMLTNLEDYRYCGDWFLYTQILLNNHVAYQPTSLNSFRRHGSSVTDSNAFSSSYIDEMCQIRKSIFSNILVSSKECHRSIDFLIKDYQVKQTLKSRVLDFDLASWGIKHSSFCLLYVADNEQNHIERISLFVTAAEMLYLNGFDVEVCIDGVSLTGELKKRVNMIQALGVDVCSFVDFSKRDKLQKYVDEKVVAVIEDNQRVKQLLSSINYIVPDINKYLSADRVLFAKDSVVKLIRDMDKMAEAGS